MIAANGRGLKGANPLMAVIGRLDEQVDAVLIEPLRRTGERADDRHDPTAEEAAPARPPITPVQSEDADARPAAHELPVWLL